MCAMYHNKDNWREFSGGYRGFLKSKILFQSNFNQPREQTKTGSDFKLYTDVEKFRCKLSNSIVARFKNKLFLLFLQKKF